MVKFIMQSQLFVILEDIGQQSDEENPEYFIVTDGGFAEGMLAPILYIP